MLFRKKMLSVKSGSSYMYWPATYEYFSWEFSTEFWIWTCSMPGSICLTLIWGTYMLELGGPPCPLDSGPSFSFHTSLSLLCIYKHHPPPLLLLQGRANLLVVFAGGAVWLHHMWAHLREPSPENQGCTGTHLVQTGAWQMGWSSLCHWISIVSARAAFTSLIAK